jgi:hypothetical protein
MDCEQALALWQAHMDRELQPEDRPRLEMHLRECARCRAGTEAHRLQDADLRRVFAQRRRASSAVAERVIAQLRVKSPRLQRRIPWLALVLSAAAGFLIAVLLFRPWVKSPEPDLANRQDKTIRPVHETPQQRPEVIILALATGADEACEILAPGETAWRVLKLGGEIAFGTRVRTNPKARCEFHTADGSEVRLNGGTEVLFAERRRLELAQGQILARVAEAAAPFRVLIPEATITAVGTEFDVLRLPIETVLTVVEGATKVESKDHWQTIQTGERATIINGLVARKQHLGRELLQAVTWADDLLKLKAPNNKELTRRVNDILAQIGETKMNELPEDQIRSLGTSCVVPLTRYVQSERSKGSHERHKRVAAARILADLAQPWSVADLIELLGDGDKEVRYYAAVALKRLTKETLGHESAEWRDRSPSALKTARQDWRRWWSKNKDRYPELSQLAR